MNQPSETILFLGFGNIDREDDGIAWHILHLLAHRLGRPFPSSPDEEFVTSPGCPVFYFVLQLVPELAEMAAEFDRVCFIDAHTGNFEEDIRFQPVEPGYQSSAFTHHLTPPTMMSLVSSLYGKNPEAMLLSIRGFEFGFSRQLSSSAQGLLFPAVDTLQNWLYRKQ